MPAKNAVLARNVHPDEALVVPLHEDCGWHGGRGVAVGVKPTFFF